MDNVTAVMQEVILHLPVQLFSKEEPLVLKLILFEVHQSFCEQGRDILS